MLSRYVSYRQSYVYHPARKGRTRAFDLNRSIKHLPEEHEGLLSSHQDEGNGDAVIEMNALPPRWSDVQEEVVEILTRITQDSANLDGLHRKHLLPGFDDEHVKQAEERQIDHLTQKVTGSFHQCHQLIRAVESMVSEARRVGTLKKGDDIMAKNIQVALASRVQEASTAFRKRQSIYLSSMLLG